MGLWHLWVATVCLRGYGKPISLQCAGCVVCPVCICHVLVLLESPALHHTITRRRFTFGRPDVELLRQFCAAKFGWEPQYAEQQLAPVVQAYDQRQVGM